MYPKSTGNTHLEQVDLAAGELCGSSCTPHSVLNTVPGASIKRRSYSTYLSISNLII